TPDGLEVSVNLAGVVSFARRTPQRRNPIPTWAWIAAALALMLLLLISAVVAWSRPARLAAGSIAIDEGYDIVVMGPNGSDRRSVTTGPNSDWQPAFSPDGTWLAYWDADPTSGVGVCGACVPGPHRLVLADLRDPGSPAPRVLTQVAPEAPTTLSWSPDSRYL